jgi:uncharacterized membrane protein
MANTTPTEIGNSQYGVIPAGQEVDVRLNTTLSSKTAQVEQRFDATTVADLTQNGRVLVPMRAMAANVFQSGGIRDEGTTAGIGAGAGGILGGVLGGVKGAIIGAVVGAGGAIAATNGTDIDLPAGSIVRIRLDQPLSVR